MDRGPNALFVLRNGNLRPCQISKSGLKVIQHAVKRIGGPWAEDNRPYGTYIVMDRENLGLSPLEVHDVLLDVTAVIEEGGKDFY